jgi:CRISPR-associated endonuclease Csy4
MQFYQDITLLPDPETDLYFLWKKVYQQIHLALVEMKGEDGRVGIGLSFPKYCYGKSRKHLGNKLRIFASSEQELADLDVPKWLSRLLDYVHFTQVRQVPEKTDYVHFSRRQIKSLEKVAKRRATHLSIPYEEAFAFLVKEERSDECDLPFIQMESLSSKVSDNGTTNRFPLFIKKNIADMSKDGRFDCYGLSKTATVPWF